MTRRDDPPMPPTRELDPELAATLKRVGPENYGRVTASLFARGGRFNPKRKPRYAIT